MELNSKNNKILIVIGTIIAIIVLTLGITYAYFAAQSSTEIQTVTSGTLNVGFTNGDILRTSGLIPIKDELIDSRATEINFTVKNTGNITGYFDVNLTEISIANELKNSYFKWRLIEDNQTINEGDFVGVTSTKQLYNSIKIEPQGEKTYKLLIWIKESSTAQNEMQGKNLIARVTVNAKNFKLPSIYQEVEYIESTGTQEINTGYYANGKTRIETEFAFTQNQGQQRAFGAQSYVFRMDLYQNGSGNFACAFQDNDGQWFDTGMPIDLVKHKVILQNSILNIDGKTSNFTVSSANKTSDVSLCLFSGNKVYYSHMKLYSFKIYDNNELTRDFTPCYRKSDGIVGLYDLVHGVFYTNSGTGTFIAGNTL